VGELGAILHTTDGGATWVWQTSGTRSNLYSVFFIGPDIATAVGGRSILRTTDGGATWTRQSGRFGGGFGNFDVHFTDVSTGTVVGDAGSILRTTTGGQ